MTSLQHAVLFDLDGTLLDSAADFAAALNCLLQEESLPALPLEKIRHAAGQGAYAMLKVGMQIEPTDARAASLRQRLLALYAKNLAQKTALFQGVKKVLNHLEKQGITWGIVTNRPEHLTTTLLSQLTALAGSACVVCGDTLPYQKPHPAPLLHASTLIKRAPMDCIYVGDLKTDVEASLRAGMLPLVATYGYGHPEENPATWGAAGLLHHPEDLIHWLEK